MSQKSYNGNPTLYLIPTPIGNLDDITIRTISILKEVEVLFCEDTRETSLLLKKLNIKKKLIANHEYNEEENYAKLENYLQNGYNVGLVSDRGTPVISDPGYVLANYAIKNGYNVVALPGPTALIPALITSGLAPMPFLFYGFLNSKESKRKKELMSLKEEKATMIFYEAPHRINKTLNNMLEIFGNRFIAISREITKKYEEIYRGAISELMEQMVDIKGELVIIVSGNKEEKDYGDLSINDHVQQLVDLGYSKMEAIKLVAKERNLSKNDVYKKIIGD